MLHVDCVGNVGRPGYGRRARRRDASSYYRVYKVSVSAGLVRETSLIRRKCDGDNNGLNSPINIIQRVRESMPI